MPCVDKELKSTVNIPNCTEKDRSSLGKYSENITNCYINNCQIKLIKNMETGVRQGDEIVIWNNEKINGDNYKTRN